MQPLLVRDLMTSPVLTIRPSTRLPAIKQIMCERCIHRLPVVERDRLVGIVTLGDVRNAFPSDLPALNRHPQPRLDAIRAEHLMRTDVIAIAAEAPLMMAAELLLLHKVSGLPVLADERLVGIITKGDLCRAVLDGKLVAAPLMVHTSRAEGEMFLYPAPAIEATVEAVRVARR